MTIIYLNWQLKMINYKAFILVSVEIVSNRFIYLIHESYVR